MFQDRAATCLRNKDQGSSSLESPDIALQRSRQSAADMIRNGSSPPLSQSSDAKGIDSTAPSQVDPTSRTLLSKEPKGPQRNYREALALMQKDGTDTPLPASLQEYKDQQDHEEKKAKRLATVPSSKDIGQRVLGMTFCVNRLGAISRLAADSKLSDFTNIWAVNSRIDDVKGSHLFKRFQRLTVER
jgi:hypothetical protein